MWSYFPQPVELTELLHELTDWDVVDAGTYTGYLFAVCEPSEKASDCLRSVNIPHVVLLVRVDRVHRFHRRLRGFRGSVCLDNGVQTFLKEDYAVLTIVKPLYQTPLEG